MPGGESEGAVLSVLWEWGSWGFVEVLGILGVHGQRGGRVLGGW